MTVEVLVMFLVVVMVTVVVVSLFLHLTQYYLTAQPSASFKWIASFSQYIFFATEIVVGFILKMKHVVEKSAQNISKICSFKTIVRFVRNSQWMMEGGQISP